ncbi:MAG: DNA polymerase bacteriophage-type [Puniceicoccaceae bacterium 5H]|nr:MAG: DNA polymerase bacteriophage-type [Puniceicoccaceae bacterium 5H]
MRREGVDSLYLTPETLEQLRAQVSKAAAAHPQSPTEIKLPPLRTASAQTSAADLKLELPSTAEAVKESRPKPAAQSGRKLPEPPTVKLPRGSKQKRWDVLREKVYEDPVCQEQAGNPERVVFGVGSLDAEIFFCGEAPGADEEVQREPFVGAAGQLLTKIIGAMGLSREQVYIGNIMNWRPDPGNPMRKGNRPPTPEEMGYCLPYLRAQLDIVQPKVIVALGGTAINGLIGGEKKISVMRVRGHWHDFDGVPLMPTFHPSYLLRNSTKESKRQLWEDMLQVMERVELPISEKQRGYFQK